MIMSHIYFAGIGVIVIGLAYWWKSRRSLKQAYKMAVNSMSTPSNGSNERHFHLPMPTYKNGQYENPEEWKPPNFPGFAKAGVQMMLTKNKSNIPSQEVLDQTLPVKKINEDTLAVIPKHGVQATWLGHASVLVQMEGINILADPIFSERCSFSQWAGPKRYRPIPCAIKELPRIHAVVISHNHYDHLDRQTVLDLNARFGGDLHWFVPMGNAIWFCQAGCPKDNIHEMTWWETYTVPQMSHITFVFTPTQHWANRSVNDMRKTLWGSWSVIGQTERFFFAGDTGYCDGFKDIGRMYGPFTLSAIPIGAYFPRSVMRRQHVNPEEAVQIHLDVKSRNSVAIHWGTFMLTYEHYLEPPEKLKKALEDAGLSSEEFITLKHGETRIFTSVERDLTSRSLDGGLLNNKTENLDGSSSML